MFSLNKDRFMAKCLESVTLLCETRREEVECPIEVCRDTKRVRTARLPNASTSLSVFREIQRERLEEDDQTTEEARRQTYFVYYICVYFEIRG